MFLPYNFEAPQFKTPNISGRDPKSSLPNTELAGKVNQFMTGQAVMPFLQNLPGYANMVGQRSENALSMLSGEIPGDVQNQIAQRAAERGIAGGTPGSANTNAAYLRALGLTSLDMTNQGSQLLTQSIADTPVPELWNPMSLYVPERLAAVEAGYAQQGIAAGKAAATPAPKEYSYATIDAFGQPNYKYKFYM